MAKKKKYYVVWEGAKTGIYDDWNTCKAQIAGYPKAKYKSFKTKEEAESAFRKPYAASIKPKTKNIQNLVKHQDIVWNSISVDAACSGNPGLMEYQGVVTKTKEQIFHQGPFREGTNNIGEFLGIVHALAFLQKENRPDVSIYTDSRTAMAWVRNKKVKSTLVETSANKKVFILIKRALVWLHNNSYNNPILKWETKSWGEIPADFGRK